MKRMLIIGNEHPNIESVAWDDVDPSAITDYQVLLIDLTSYPTTLPIKNAAAFRYQTNQLLNHYYDVIYILPRCNFDSPFSDIFAAPNNGIKISTKTGKTISFNEDNPIMNVYKKFIKKHEIIISNSKQTSMLMQNNVEEICSFEYCNAYFLHPPEKHFHKQAIKSLVDYFSPDIIDEDQEKKPDWASQLELTELGLQKIEDKICSINRQIEKLKRSKEVQIAEKREIAKWSDLLTRQGKTLEIRIKEALEFLGIQKVQHEPNGSHGPDLTIEHKSMFFTVEIEGSKGSIKIDKARQLLHWVADAPINHKGILIANSFREISPKERPPKDKNFFVKEATDLAQKRDFALIRTQDIFHLVSKKIKGESIELDEVINKIHKNKGFITLI